MHASFSTGIAPAHGLAVPVDGPIHLPGNPLGVPARTAYQSARGAVVRAAGTGAGNPLRRVVEHCADGMVMARVGAEGYADTAVSTAGCCFTSIHTSTSRTAPQAAVHDLDESKQPGEDDASATSGPPEAIAQDVGEDDISSNAYNEPAVSSAGEALAGARGEGAGEGEGCTRGHLPSDWAEMWSLLEAICTPTSVSARKSAAYKALAEILGWDAQHKIEKAELLSQAKEARRQCDELQARIDNEAALTRAELDELRLELDAAKKRARRAEMEAQDFALAAELSADELSLLHDKLRQLRTLIDRLGAENHTLLALVLGLQQPLPA